MSDTTTAGDTRDKIAAARVWLMRDKPFFGVLARALRVEPSRGTPALRLLPDDRLLASPDFIAALSFPALCARLAHVALHAALAAFARRGERDAMRWNLAHDLAIEPLLAAAELGVGATALALAPLIGSGTPEPPDLPALPAGASAEAYYDALPASAAPAAVWCDLSDPAGDDADTPAPGVPLPNADHGARWGGGRDLDWKMRLAAALEEEIASGGKTFGDTPAWLEEMVRATIEPPADWSATLQQAIAALQRSERCFLRPSRRLSALAGPDGAWPDTVSMPGRRVLPAGQLVVVVDTSASIPAATLARFLGTVAAAATAEGIDEVRLLHADATITRDETRAAAELFFVEVPMTGRGGTDFAPALAALALEARAAGRRFTVVYLTDLDGRFPPEPATLDVVWVVPHDCERAPPFGRVLPMQR